MSTTLNKLEYLDETKQQIKDALNTGFNAQIQDTDTFRSYVSKINNIYNNWPKVTGEDTTLSLTPTKKGRLGITLKGNSGDNLFDISKITANSFIDNNGNVYPSSASNLSDYIAVDTGNYTLSYNYTTLVSDSTRAYCYFDSNKTFLSGAVYSPTNKTTVFNIPNNAKYFRFTYDKNCSDIQFKKDSAVTGDNSIEVVGKNLFNKSVEKKSAYPTTTIGSVVSYVNSVASASYVKCCYLEAGITYTFSCKLNTPASPTYRDSVIVDENNIVLEHFYLWNDSTSHTYTPSHSGYLILCVDNNSTELMLEKGNQATTYEEYKGASYPISLGNTKLSTGDSIQGSIDNWSIVRADTTTEPITDTTLISQLNNLKNNAISYDTQTNITQTNDDLPFIISSTALKKGGN